MAYLRTGKVMTPRQDLRPTVEGAAGRKTVELKVFARLRQISIVMAIFFITLTAIAARRALIRVRSHADGSEE